MPKNEFDVTLAKWNSVLISIVAQIVNNPCCLPIWPRGFDPLPPHENLDPK